VRLLSFQKGQGTEQLSAWTVDREPWTEKTRGPWTVDREPWTVEGESRSRATSVITDLGSRLDESFMDTAAALMNVDLVITIDTALAHLAGALGLPVWVALPVNADWRWLRERDDSPWYPTMRLFRQRRVGDWANVFQRIRDALREKFGP
jgi:hypothetical protein